MKFLVVILIFASSSYSQSEEKIPLKIQQKIDKGIDYYNLSLYEDSKKIFLDLLYTDDGKKYEAEIRYHLGLISFYERNSYDAQIQWKKLIKKFPSNKRSKELSRTADRWDRIKDEDNFNKEENREFGEEKEFGELFWDFKRADQKLLFGELKDAGIAVKYYEKLYEKYDDPRKKFEISLRLFALYGGFNENNYGYKNQSSYGSAASSDPYKSLSLNAFFQKSNQILDQMESNLTSEFDVNNSLFIMWNYLWAVKLSDSEFWSEKAKSNDFSEPNFAKVIALTNSQPNNIYRLFSVMYLGDKANKYVVSEEKLSKYESYGFTPTDLLALSRRNISEDYWIELKERNIDYSLIINNTFFIRSLNLEKALKKGNLISTYTFEDLQNNIRNIDKWSTLFVSPNPPKSNEKLMTFINNIFKCDDIDCFIKNKIVIKQNLFREINKLGRKKTADQNFINFLPLSTLIIIKKNNISAEDFAKLYIKERKLIYQD